MTFAEKNIEEESYLVTMNIKKAFDSIEIFKHVFLCTAYVDDSSTFFLRNIPSVKELINSYQPVLSFLRFKR